MGRVMPTIKLTNLFDMQKADEGAIASSEVRSVEVEALVDTGATALVLTAEIATALGLVDRGTRKVRYADGRIGEVRVVVGVVLEILGREMTGEALVPPGAHQALIGQIPLEALDLIVDPKSRDLRVNPESPDAPLLDLYAAAIDHPHARVNVYPGP